MLLSNVVLSQNHQDIITKDGIIHFEIYGEGNPILIINGGPGMNSEGFRSLAAIIGKTNRAIIYDQRGTGQSIIPIVDATTITMDAMVEDIEALRTHLDINEWTVLGHSFGGMLASYYASKHPATINSLILSSSGGINLDLFSNIDIDIKLSPEERDSLSYWGTKISNGDTSYHARLQRGKYLAPAYLYDKSNVDIIAVRLTQGNEKVNALVFEDMRMKKFDCTSALEKFTKPVLIIQGEDDVIKRYIADSTHGIFSNSTLKMLKKCGHYGWLDQPEAYFNAIATFLNDLKK